MKNRKMICDDFRNVSVENDVDLFICDPPYGGIINDEYDKISNDDLVDFLIEMLNWMSKFSHIGTSAYVFGGVGKYKHRPFMEFILRLERETKWRVHNFITWAKRRGYGTQKNWMFAREEILFLVYGSKYPAYFNVPYREEERSDAWKKRLSRQGGNEPKTNKLRYTNVIYDINEIFRNSYKGSGCVITAEKPEKLIRLLIETSCPENGFVVDPMCGSGTVGKVVNDHFSGIGYTIIEKDPSVFSIAKSRIMGGGGE